MKEPLHAFNDFIREITLFSLYKTFVAFGITLEAIFGLREKRHQWEK